MPEGHTIHRIARDHTKWFAGQSLAVLSPQGRFADQAKKLSGKKLISIEAFGKHLLYNWTDGLRMHIHLGLYGKYRIHKNPAPEPRGAVRIRAIGAERTFDLNGPNQCELISKTDYETLRGRIGQDPLRDDADPEKIWERIRKSRSTIGQLLLNQSLFAGIGNIYRTEILFLLSIHPERLGKEISREEFDAIWDCCVRLLQTGMKYNRIITVEHPVAALTRLKRGQRFNIYKTPQCPRCNSDIYYWELGARTVYACEECQK